MYHDELGPDSFLWRYAGDTRIAFLGGTIGLLQLMHPAIGAGVMEHSNFFEDPFDRVFRSLPAILGVIYDDDPEATGRWVRDQHTTIKGVDEQGRRYHALDPETYWWAHATFQFMTEQVVDRFSHRELSPAEREQLYQEGVVWYGRYGVSEREVPPDRRAFQEKWDHYCAEVLETNDAVAYVVDLVNRPIQLDLPTPLRPLNLALRTWPLSHFASVPSRISAIGGLPATVRERFDISWSTADRLRLDALELAVRKTWRFAPFSVRWQPRAQEAWRRVEAERRGDAWPAAS